MKTKLRVIEVFYTQLRMNHLILISKIFLIKNEICKDVIKNKKTLIYLSYIKLNFIKNSKQE